MRAHQIMTRNVITVTPETSVAAAASKMLQNRISGMPVLDRNGRLAGIVSEGDFLRRSEIGTQHRRSHWLQFLIGPGKTATEFVRERGRKVGDIMTPDPLTVSEDASLDDIVQLMEKNNVKRLPVMLCGKVVGIVTRTNILQAVASLAKEIPDPTADDDHIRDRVLRAIEQNDWRPLGLQVAARNGVVHLHGMILDERTRQAAIVAAENVAGVKSVHDHLSWVDAQSGLYLNSQEDEVALTRAAS